LKKRLWGAAGTEQAQGTWRVKGSLRQGNIYLLGQNGNQTILRCQVHVKGGEPCVSDDGGGEDPPTTAEGKGKTCSDEIDNDGDDLIVSPLMLTDDSSD
jgi:hypothetical protein